LPCFLNIPVPLVHCQQHRRSPLNLLFILVLQLGVLGSALGTVLAQGITMLVTLYLLAKMDRQEEEPVSPKPDLSWTKIKSILHIALPTIFQQFAITFGVTLVQAWVNPFGQEAISILSPASWPNLLLVSCRPLTSQKT